MSTTVTPLSDGGRLESWTDGGVHLQKYNAAGEKVGPETVISNENVGPEIVPLSNGGWVVVGGFAFRGYDYRANVFDGGGQKVALFNLPGDGAGYDIAASPDGGFLIVTMERNPSTPPGSAYADYSFQPYITLYDNAGAVVRGPVAVSGDLPTVSVQADGDYLVQWNDGGIARSLEIDPQNPPALEKPPAPVLTILDDQGPNTGPVGDYTTDATPIARVTVTEVGTVLVTRVDGGGGYEPAPDGGVPVTAEDVARGYIDVPVPNNAADTMPTTWHARFKTADGVVSDRTSDSFTFILRPEIWTATDDQGASTGEIAAGATTDDATPTLQIGLESSGMKAGETLYVREGGTAVGQTVLTAEDVARGYVVITTTALSDGQHTLHPNNGGPGLAFTFTVAATPASAPGDTAPTFQTSTGASVANGGIVSNVEVLEANFRNGTQPENSQTVTRFGSIYISAADGIDDLTLAGQSVIIDGVFTYRGPLELGNAQGITFSSYDADTGRLNFTYGLRAPLTHAQGQETIPFSYEAVLTDFDGDRTTATMVFNVHDDFVSAGADSGVAQVGGSYSGNLLTNDRGADGIVVSSLNGTATSTASGLTATGQRGTLTVNANGTFTYTARADASAGNDVFSYNIRDPEGDSVAGALTMQVDAAPSSAGQELYSDQYGDTLQGGAGEDTLHAGRGPDQLTGGAGADAFVYGDLPWNAGRVTDFAMGTDRLDLSALFQASGYTGSNPQADGYIRLQSDFAGGTVVYYDTDGSASGNTIWFKITTLQGVSGATWSQLAGGSEPPPPPRVGFTTTLVQKTEGNSGSTPFEFTVTRSGDTSGTTSMSWSVLGTPAGQSASSDDFAAGAALSGNLTFAAGETTKTITVQVAGDTIPEQNETFRVVLQGISGGGYEGTGSATGSIVNDDSSQPPPSGQVLTSDQYADTLQGGSGNDTLIAGRGPDQLTGGAGGDAFVYRDTPWNAGHVTDFAVGADRLDVSAILQAHGYSGSDPVADGWVSFEASGGGTKVFLDTNGPASGGDWPFLITTLDGVAVTSWAQLSGGSPPPPPPPPEEGQVLTSDQYGDSLQGGAGNDTLNAGQGPDQLTGAGGADRFVFDQFPWNAGHVTDFTPGVDQLDLRALFDAAGYMGSDPIGDGRLEFRPDGQGNTQVYIDRDDPNGGDWPFLITTLNGVLPNQIGAGDWLA